MVITFASSWVEQSFVYTGLFCLKAVGKLGIHLSGIVMGEVQGRLSIVLMEQGHRAKAESIQLALSSSKHNYL